MKRLACVIVLAACSGDPPQVRLCNDTGFDINALAWGRAYTSDFVANSACTEYETPTYDVYHLIGLSFRVQTDEFAIVPLDFVGETPLGDGSWSYHLTIIDYPSRSASVGARRD
jgi:hypothetical protein